MAFRKTQHIVLLIAAAALYGCGGAPPKQTGGEDNFGEGRETTASGSSDTPAPADTDNPKWSSKPSPAVSTDSGGLTEDQKAQMEIALRRGGEKSANCASVVPDGPRGEGEVKVLFDGKKGRCVDVTVGPPFAGTPIESCIKRSFVGEIVVPFDGDLEVPYTVKLGPKAGAADAAKDPKDKAKDPKDKGKKK